MNDYSLNLVAKLDGSAPRILKQRKKEANSEDVDMSDVLDDFQRKARDHARVPMQVLSDVSCIIVMLTYRSPVGRNGTCWVHEWNTMDACQ